MEMMVDGGDIFVFQDHQDFLRLMLYHDGFVVIQETFGPKKVSCKKDFKMSEFTSLVSVVSSCVKGTIGQLKS